MNDNPKGILIHFIGYPLKVLGPGTRVGIWLQGCTIHCNGCISAELWDFNSTTLMGFDEITIKLRNFLEYHPDGVTISGGEPFDQPEEFLLLLKILQELGYPSIMVYSGYSFEYLSEFYHPCLDFIDILVSGPFVLEETDKRIWRGSDNQQIHILSTRANATLDENSLNRMEFPDNRTLQIFRNLDSSFVAGIPKRSDLGELLNLKN